MTRYAVAIAALMLLAGCGGTSDEAAPSATTVPAASSSAAAYTPPSEPAYTPPTEQGEYAAPGDVIAALNARGISCRTQDPPTESITGSMGQSCFTPDHNPIRVDIYYTSAQQADGVQLLKGNNWQVVEGRLWTVSAMSPKVATQVAQALKN